MFELWRARRERNKAYNDYERKIKALTRAKAPREKIHELEFEQWADSHFYDIEIGNILTTRLIDEAARYDIALPDADKMWDRDGNDPKAPRWLSFEGRAELRKRIHEERSRRFEANTLWVTKFWVPLLAALIGILGAITGLVAVIQHKK